MGSVRLKIRELAQERAWSLKEVSTRSGVNYSTLKTYAQSSGMATVDATALIKLARVFEVAIEDLIEIVEE
jgi:putative transcriptional regulator